MNSNISKQNAPTKPSGIDWIGDIPSDWGTYPGFYLIRETKKKNFGFVEKSLLSLSYGNIIQKVDQNIGLTPASFETYQIVSPGQIVFRLTDLQNDKKSLRSGLVKERGIITSAYTAIKATNDVAPAFLNYLYRSYDHVKVFYTLGSGVRQSSGFSELKRIPLVLPPKETQEKIVAYLDKKTAAVDEVIAKKKRLIGLLKEKRSSIITHAVTKGLDPHAPTKPSGIDWIGDIPSGWDIKRLGQLSRIETGGTPSKNDSRNYSTQGTIWVKPDNLEEFIPITNSKEKLSLFGSRLVPVIPTGAVLVNCIGDVGKIGVAGIDLATNQQINSVIFKGGIIQSFGKYMLFAGRDDAKANSNSVVVPILSKSRHASLRYAVPPKETQEKIVAYLDEKTKQIDDTVAKIDAQIGLLAEYRASLIYHCVTGRIAVE